VESLIGSKGKYIQHETIFCLVQALSPANNDIGSIVNVDTRFTPLISDTPSMYLRTGINILLKAITGVLMYIPRVLFNVDLIEVVLRQIGT
jgi:hypothetical protein